MENAVAALFAAVIFGAIGAAYLLYGKRAQNPIFLAVGVSLWAFSAVVFFATWIFLGLGIACIFLPFVLRR